ncbi:MAG: hypothetical protein GXP31_08190 [Kiritimatiellaeota bacterium]|nr:hypothetical protein [Kiritimatiellota bacterium]
MNCREVQHQLLLHGMEGVSAELRRHAGECSRCRAFEQTWRLVLEEPSTDEPPAALDRAVTAAARARARRTSPVYRRREFWLFSRAPIRTAAAAAAVAFLLWTFWFQGHGPNRRSATAEYRVAMTRTPSQPVWDDAGVDDNLLLIETALATMGDIGSGAPATEWDAGTPDAGAAASIDEAIQRLDADIYFEQEGLRQRKTAPPSAPRAQSDRNGGLPVA